MGKLREQFGDSVDLAPEFRYEWLSIPHIYQTPFYCYAYSFGQLLVLALYRRFQEEGEATNKWDRARLSSTQLCEYFLGSVEMHGLEREARRRSADRAAGRGGRAQVLRAGLHR